MRLILLCGWRSYKFKDGAQCVDGAVETYGLIFGGGGIQGSNGRRLGFLPSVRTSMMHPCGFGVSYLMLCIVFWLLDGWRSSPTNPLFSWACLLLRLFVAWQWSWGQPGKSNLHCARRTRYCPRCPEFFLFSLLINGRICRGGAAPGLIFHIFWVRRCMVSVVALLGYHVIMFAIPF